VNNTRHPLAILLFFSLSLTLPGCKAQSATEPVGKIDKLVAAAKSQGKTVVNIDPSDVYPPEISTIDEGAKGSKVLLVQLIASTSRLGPERNDVWTWYKFLVKEDLSRQAISSTVDSSDPSLSVPATLLKVRS
jgi:hypothetical protein